MEVQVLSTAPCRRCGASTVWLFIETRIKFLRSWWLFNTTRGGGVHDGCPDGAPGYRRLPISRQACRAAHETTDQLATPVRPAPRAWLKPVCFPLAETQGERVNIPVSHDDPHGTAISAGATPPLLGEPIVDVCLVVCGGGSTSIVLSLCCAAWVSSASTSPP